MQNIINRSEYIGGSDIAGIVGLSRWRTPVDVYLEKTGEAPEQKESEAMYWGRALESVILDRWEKDTGDTFGPRTTNRNLKHYLHDHLRGTVDALVTGTTGEDILIEIKTSRLADGWGEPGTDQVPTEYLLQATWYMALLASNPLAINTRCEIPVLIGGQDYRVYRVEYNKELGDTLIERAVSFWQNHVIPRIPPEAQGRKEVVMLCRYAQEKPMVATEELLKLYNEAIDLSDIVVKQSANLDKIKDAIAVAMGDVTELVDERGAKLVSFAPTKSGMRPFKIIKANLGDK